MKHPRFHSEIKSARPPDQRPLDITYDTLYSRESYPAMGEDTRLRHRRLMLRIKKFLFNAGEESRDLPVDPAMCIILNRIMLYSAEGLDLDDPGEVERVRERYCALLWRYLEVQQDKREDGNRAALAARFGEGLMIGSLAREIMDITSEERR